MAVYEDTTPLVLRSIPHSTEELSRFNSVTDQFGFRKQLVLDELERTHTEFRFDAVIGRGGLAKPVAGGVYAINQRMLDDVRRSEEHTSELQSRQYLVSRLLLEKKK